MVWDLVDVWLQETYNLYVNGRPFLVGVLATILVAAWFERDMILERIMSRRQQRKLHKQEMAEVADGFSYLLETMVEAKKLRPVTKKRLIRKLTQLGVKDVGYEPNMGVPKHASNWADPRPSINLLKVQIAERLPKGLFAKFLNRRVEKPKKVEGMFSFMNEVRQQLAKQER